MTKENEYVEYDRWEHPSNDPKQYRTLRERMAWMEKHYVRQQRRIQELEARLALIENHKYFQSYVNKHKDLRTTRNFKWDKEE